MTRTDYYASPNAHLLIGEMPAPRQMSGSWREGTGLSIAAHAVVVGLLLYAATHVKQVAQTINAVSKPLVFLGLGGGGGGVHNPAGPPRPVQIVETRPAQMAVVPNPADTPPPPELNIPVITAHAVELLPGSLTAMDGTAPGRGAGPGGGDGRGPGSGPGEGPGLGPGRLGGFGDDVFVRGNAVSSPQLIKEVKPNYTADAMRAKLQGVVEMQAVVLPDGTVDPSRIRITRSLDASYGLDQQAIIAVKQWRFHPGMRSGQAVAAWVTVELTFTLR
jgi:periplasmic protein TonB